MLKSTSVLASLTVLVALASAASAADSPAKKRILYITTTAGFHHSACEYSVPVFQKMAADSGWLEVTASDKTDLISKVGLQGFDAVIFSNTTGGKGQFPLSEENGLALIDFVKAGGAFIGIHAATDTLADWAPYAELVGGSFNGHPWTKKIKADVEDPGHPSAVHLPNPWWIDDEIYTFKNWSRSKVHVILSLDPEVESNKGNRDDRDYALAWCMPFEKGRVFYTALGHRHEVWDDPMFQTHLMGGIAWALRNEPTKTRDEKKVAMTHPLAIGHAKPGPWVKIFDGSTLAWGSDWEATDDPAESRKHWSVQPGGILQGMSETDGSSHLYYTKKKYKNFEYRAEVCINKDGNSGMYFRCLERNKGSDGRWKNWPAGYEAQVNNGWDPDPRKSGTFYPEPSIREPDLKRILGYDKAKDDGNFWFTQHIIAVGNHVVIKLDGKIAVDSYDFYDRVRRDPGYYTEGYFAFQFHHKGTVVKFRNIEVRELP